MSSAINIHPDSVYKTLNFHRYSCVLEWNKPAALRTKRVCMLYSVRLKNSFHNTAFCQSKTELVYVSLILPSLPQQRLLLHTLINRRQFTTLSLFINKTSGPLHTMGEIQLYKVWEVEFYGLLLEHVKFVLHQKERSGSYIILGSLLTYRTALHVHLIDPNCLTLRSSLFLNKLTSRSAV